MIYIKINILYNLLLIEIEIQLNIILFKKTVVIGISI